MAKPRKATSRSATSEPKEVDETKRAKFERIALARMNRALNAVRLIGNLASYNYDWNEDDVAKMRATMLDLVAETFGRFARHKRGEKPTFSFEETAISQSDGSRHR